MAEEGLKTWTTRPDIAARLLIQQGKIILQMYHGGKLDDSEAGEMLASIYNQKRLGEETREVVDNGGVLPLSGQTSRLLMLNWRTNPTEEPKP